MLLQIFILTNLFLTVSATSNTFIVRTSQNKLKYHDIWYEVNDSIVLNCSLRVGKDQHVSNFNIQSNEFKFLRESKHNINKLLIPFIDYLFIHVLWFEFKIVWHRKYEKMGVHVLTIGSETFISDLRIRPIKEHFNKNNELMSRDRGQSSEMIDAFESQIHTNTWNLEIRRLRKDDTALYYCVLNSENSYGQIYRLNVLRKNLINFLNQLIILYAQFWWFVLNFSPVEVTQF